MDKKIMEQAYMLAEGVIKKLMEDFSGKIVGSEDMNKEKIMSKLSEKSKSKQKESKKERPNFKIAIESINRFTDKSNRSENDISNKIREKIIEMIGNKEIENDWFNDNQWNKLRDEIQRYEYINSPDTYDRVKWIQKAGRRNSYDFDLEYYNNINEKIKTRRIEFKYNAETLSDCPQWSSPMYPSNYLICDKSYEEYFYDNYLIKICERFGREMPNKEEYLKQIHRNVSISLSDLQEKFYKGSSGSKKNYTGLDEDIKFYKFCQKVSKESFNNYFKICELDYEKLNKYLIEKQKNKEYMLYKDGIIYHEVYTYDDYTIKPDKIIKESPNFKCETFSGRGMKILFRWKNGFGIAFPAFQIS